jgi:peptidoglycan/LPS O-acetylase OafA/YrhL
MHLNLVPLALFYNVTLSQVLMGNLPPLDPAFWSLCVELQFYVAVTVWLLLLKRGSRCIATIFAWLILVVSICLIQYQNVSQGIPANMWFMAFPHYAPLFFFGAGMAWFRVQLQKKDAVLSTFHLLGMVVTFLTIVITVSWGWLVAALIIVASMAARQPILNKVGSPLRWRFLLFFGERSYSIYLVHGLGVHYLSHQGAVLLKKNVILAICVLLFTWFYCVVSGALYYRLIECRFIHTHKS